MLTDVQWERLSPQLPGQENSPGTTAKDTRLFVEAVLWRARCGVSWRDLPAERFGPWHTVYTRFRRWRQAGVWPGCGRRYWPKCKTRRVCTGSWSIPQPCAHTRWRPEPKKRQSGRAGARPQPGRFHDQAPPELRCLRPDLRPGPDWRTGRRLPASSRAAAYSLAGRAGRVGRPGIRRGLRARPDWANRSPGRDSKQKEPDDTNRTRR